MKGRLYQKLLTAEATIRKLEKEIKRLKSELEKYKRKEQPMEDFAVKMYDDKMNGVISDE